MTWNERQRHLDEMARLELAVKALIRNAILPLAFLLLGLVLITLLDGCALIRGGKDKRCVANLYYPWGSRCEIPRWGRYHLVALDGQWHVRDTRHMPRFFEDCERDVPASNPAQVDAILDGVADMLELYPRSEIQDPAARRYAGDHWAGCADAFAMLGRVPRPRQVAQLLAVTYLNRSGHQARGYWYPTAPGSQDLDPAVVLRDGRAFQPIWNTTANRLQWRQFDPMSENRCAATVDSSGLYDCGR